MWLVGVVIRRYIDILIVIINFSYSTCIRSFFGSSILTSLFILKCFFGLVSVIFLQYKTEKTFKNEQRSKDAAAKKRPTTSGVGKINNYYEDIYIPPYNTGSPHLYIVTIPIDSTH